MVVNKAAGIHLLTLLSPAAAVFELVIFSPNSLSYCRNMFVLVEAGEGRGPTASLLCHSGGSLQRWEWAMLLGLSAGSLSTTGGTTEEMLVGGRWGRQHIMSRTSMHMLSLRWDCDFCPCAGKDRFYCFKFSLSLVHPMKDKKVSLFCEINISSCKEDLSCDLASNRTCINLCRSLLTHTTQQFKNTYS